VGLLDRWLGEVGADAGAAAGEPGVVAEVGGSEAGRGGVGVVDGEVEAPRPGAGEEVGEGLGDPVMAGSAEAELTGGGDGERGDGEVELGAAEVAACGERGGAEAGALAETRVVGGGEGDGGGDGVVAGEGCPAREEVAEERAEGDGEGAGGDRSLELEGEEVQAVSGGEGLLGGERGGGAVDAGGWLVEGGEGEQAGDPGIVEGGGAGGEAAGASVQKGEQGVLGGLEERARGAEQGLGEGEGERGARAGEAEQVDGDSPGSPKAVGWGGDLLDLTVEVAEMGGGEEEEVARIGAAWLADRGVEGALEEVEQAEEVVAIGLSSGGGEAIGGGRWGGGQSRRGREAGFGWLGRHMGQVRGREGGFGWQGAAHEAGEGRGLRRSPGGSARLVRGRRGGG
jgi:hypothetical protein